MTSKDRRRFLRSATASAMLSLFPQAIRRALAIPASNTTGTIRDVQHVVIFMQENRAFDHYLGTLPGVRGFGDRITIPQRCSGPTVFIAASLAT
ncbi:alkaline phosphatase family protein [Paraburkholderia sp. A1RI-2L]